MAAPPPGADVQDGAAHRRRARRHRKGALGLPSLRKDMVRGR